MKIFASHIVITKAQLIWVLAEIVITLTIAHFLWGEMWIFIAFFLSLDLSMWFSKKSWDEYQLNMLRVAAFLFFLAYVASIMYPVFSGTVKLG